LIGLSAMRDAIPSETDDSGVLERISEEFTGLEAD
jgi:hypothetical protein